MFFFFCLQKFYSPDLIKLVQLLFLKKPLFAFFFPSKMPNSFMYVLLCHSSRSSSFVVTEYVLYFSVSPLSANIKRYLPIEYPQTQSLIILARASLSFKDYFWVVSYGFLHFSSISTCCPKIYVDSIVRIWRIYIFCR